MRNLTLRQLRALSAIGRTGRIVNAAKALNLTPPAVTLQLQQLEAEAGLRLFDRTSDGLRPTDAGHALLDTAAQVAALIAACEERLAALKGLTAGRVSVGVVSTAKYFAPNLVAAFAKAHPGIELRLTVGNRDDIVKALRDFEVDVAIMGTPPRDVPVEASLIGDHPLIIVAPPEHPLAARRRIPKARMAEEVFLTREEGSGTRTSMEVYLDGLPRRADGPLPARSGLFPTSAAKTSNPKTSGLRGRLAAKRPGEGAAGEGASRLRERIEMGSNETIKQAVMAGLGIAFISAHTVAAEIDSGRLVSLDVEGLPMWRQWFVVRRADKAMLPAAAAFAEFLITEGSGYLPSYPAATRERQRKPDAKRGPR